MIITKNFWILKSEPDVYSLEDLEKERIGRWDGVRNYQARNYLLGMKKGDFGFFYYSQCQEPGIYGLIEIIETAYPDPLAFDIESEYYDPKSDQKAPRWFSVDVTLQERFEKPLLLSEIRRLPLGDHPLIRRFNRLSIMPLECDQFNLLYGEISKIK